MTNHSDFLQIEMLDEFGEIVGILIHVVTTPSLPGTAMATTIVSDDAIALLAKKQHLRIPCVCAERSALSSSYYQPCSTALTDDRRDFFAFEHITTFCLL